jgi:glutaconate CoA-transferase, subunit B
VPKLDFCSSAGFMEGSGARRRAGAPGAGPRAVITDLGILKPATGSEELTLAARYDGVAVEAIVAATGWPLQVAEHVEVVAPPTATELKLLRDLHARTRAAHNRPAILRALKRLS